MTEYPEYFVIERLTRFELQADVTARLADGFKLAGGLHGVALVTGCELSVRRWVKIGRTVFVKQTKVNCKG